MHAVPIRARQTWRGVPITEFEREQFDARRDELDAKFDQKHASPIQHALRSPNYDKHGT